MKRQRRKLRLRELSTFLQVTQQLTDGSKPSSTCQGSSWVLSVLLHASVPGTLQRSDVWLKEGRRESRKEGLLRPRWPGFTLFYRLYFPWSLLLRMPQFPHWQNWPENLAPAHEFAWWFMVDSWGNRVCLRSQDGETTQLSDLTHDT